MKSQALNKKLVAEFPELKVPYEQETSWQDGDDTGSHVVYGDVFVPFIKEQLHKKDAQLLLKIFEYIEKILEQNDPYANEVFAFSVLEPLVFDDAVDDRLYMPFVGIQTKRIIEELREASETDLYIDEK